MRKFRVKSSELRVRTEILFYFFVSLLFIFHFSLPTASAGEVSSRAAVVIDASTGKILYAKNPDLKLAPASTTKLMTAIVVMANSVA